MPLTIGDRLGPYEILALLGKGGMGEVYKALDTRLQREVAIKVSAERFSERFEREARAIAALNHPNICTLYDVGPNYLVMEFVDGEAINTRLQSGPIPLDAAVTIARQIASALEAAHDKLITHRDLKPGNVMIKSDGVVKVLDFGLAKFGAPAQQSMGEDSPTLTMAATQAGTILGTAQYMAPEQAKGKPVDKRADIWAFGVLLHEMVTGQQLFKREDLTETLAAVVLQEPDLSAAPERIRPLLKRCLEKEPSKRLRDISGVEMLLEAAPTAPATIIAAAPKRSLLPWALAALAVGIAGVALWAPWRTPPQAAPVVLDIYPPNGERFGPNHPSLSPDGRAVALSAIRAGAARLVIRRLDSGDLIELPGTEGSNYADWSPDGRSLLFHSGGKLKRIEITGGPPQTLADFTSSSVPWKTWGPGGVILIPNQNMEIVRVPAAGGPPVNVTTLDKDPQETRHGVPQFLRDGKRFLFHARSTNPNNAGMFVASLDDLASKKKPTLIMRTESVAYYAPGADGAEYLLFYREGALMAQAFDSDALKLTGDPFLVVPSVGFNGDHPFVAASPSGALVYAASNAGGFGVANSQFRWKDRTGKVLRDAGSSSPFTEFSVAPNDSRAAVSQATNNNRDIYLLDLAPRGQLLRFSFSPDSDRYPVWSPDGSQVTFSRNGALFQKVVTGTATEQPLGIQGTPYDWSRDGQRLLFDNAGDLQIADSKKGAAGVEQFTKTQTTEKHGQFSPDGKWIVYSSDESGRQEIWLQPYPATGAKFQVSPAGGAAPRWRRDGKELFYISDGKLVAVPITLGASPQWGSATALFPLTLSSSANAFWPYSVSADGQKFLVLEALDAAATQPITVVTNWLAIAKRK